MATLMRESNTAFVGVKSSQILSRYHVPNSRLNWTWGFSL